jgi:Spy/CpxP family protein refolding chaperone
MNKDRLYIAVFAVLCVLAGVVVGAGIAKKSEFPFRGTQGKHSFSQKAERFMGQGMAERGDRKDGGGLLELLSSKLDLSEDQKDKVKVIADGARQEIDTVGKELRASMEEIRKRCDKQIADILTPEQQVKFKALLEQIEKRRGHRGFIKD